MTHHWLITGAGSGIGAATATAAVGQGDTVLALDIDETAGSHLADQTGATFQRFDVSDFEQWRSLCNGLAAQNIPDRVHLNAGIQLAPPEAPLADYRLEAMTLTRYRRMLGVNVDGVVFALHHLAPILPAGSAVVVTASLAGITPYSIDPLYAMSKHAVVGLVRSLAPTLAKRQIRINALCPGGIDTNIIPHEQRTPDADFMSPSAVADEVLRLMETPQSGQAWAKVSASKAAFAVRLPGERR